MHLKHQFEQHCKDIEQTKGDLRIAMLPMSPVNEHNLPFIGFGGSIFISLDHGLHAGDSNSFCFHGNDIPSRSI